MKSAETTHTPLYQGITMFCGSRLCLSPAPSRISHGVVIFGNNGAKTRNLFACGYRVAHAREFKLFVELLWLLSHKTLNCFRMSKYS